MQSKLPVRIKKKPVHADKKQCCCAQLIKVMLNNDCANPPRPLKGSKRIHLVSTQTDEYESYIEAEKKAYQEIRNLLESINYTLEHILDVLQDKKEYLYNKLHEEASSKKLKTYYNKNKIEKIKKKNFPPGKKVTYAWPEISRLYYGQSSWLHQRAGYDLPSSNSNLMICPRGLNWVYTSRPFSCSDINYFQPMGQMLERKPFGISIYPNPLLPRVGQGDLKMKWDKQLMDTENRQSKKEQLAREGDKEVQ